MSLTLSIKHLSPDGSVVEARPTIESSLLEHAAIGRGLTVQRLNQAILLVSGRGRNLLFRNLQGPESSRIASVICANPPRVRSILEHSAISVQSKAGDDHARVLWMFVAGPRVIASLEFHPAVAVGDGSSTLGELRERWLAQRRQNPCLGRYEPVSVPTRLDHVPGVGEQVTLCAATMPADGGDVTNIASGTHRSYSDIAVRAVKALPGLSVAAVQVRTTNPASSAALSAHWVEAVDPNPPALAHFPSTGEPTDMAGAMLEHYLGSVRTQLPQSFFGQVRLAARWFGRAGQPPTAAFFRARNAREVARRGRHQFDA